MSDLLLWIAVGANAVSAVLFYKSKLLADERYKQADEICDRTLQALVAQNRELQTTWNVVVKGMEPEHVVGGGVQ